MSGIYKRKRLGSDSDSYQLSRNSELFNAIRRNPKKSQQISEEERLEEIKECLINKANINAVDKNDKCNTLLHLAVKKRYEKIVKFLLNQDGIRINILNTHGKIALDFARDLNDQNIIRMLEEHSAGVTPKKMKLEVAHESTKKRRSSSATEVGGIISVGIGVAYPEKLQTYGIKFDKNIILDELKFFLSEESVSKKIFHIITPEETTTLSAINVIVALESLEEHDDFTQQYGKRDGYIFMCLNPLLRQKTQEYVMNAFKAKNNHNLLIIDCQSEYPENEVLDLCDKLSENLLKQKNKKVILLAKESSTLAKKLKVHFNDNLKYTKDNSSFNDLTEYSKKKLLEKEVTFQGEKISLNKLIDESDKKAKEIIDVETLVKLIKGEEIIIGRKVEGLGGVGDYYVGRRLRRATFSKEKIKGYLGGSSSKPDLFVISGTDSGLEGDNSIHVFASAEVAGGRFRELRDQNKGSNIHWLESYSEELTWYKSHGSIANLIGQKIIKKVDKTDNTRLPPFKDILDDHKVIIISDTTGIGKSTALTSLAMSLKEKDSSMWVININLNDHTKVLNNIKSSQLKFSDQNINKVVNFLLNNLLASQEKSKLKTNLEQELFKNSLNSNGKIALLFDGFDEISPCYKDIVIDLLQSLKKSKAEKIFVATRPNMCEELERALGVFHHVLDPLASAEQIEFLTKFWTKELGLKNLDKNYTERLKTYAESIIEQVFKSINDKERGFIATPLHTMMIAKVFQEDEEGVASEWQSCKEFLGSEGDKPKLLKDFSLIDLYESFVKNKFYNFYSEGKIGRDFTNVNEKRSADESYRTFKERHEMLALHTLFIEEELNKLLTTEKIQDLKALIEDIKCLEQNVGIVDQIIDNKAHFIHRTFAEYFASFFLAKQMLTAPADTLQCIDNILLNTSPIFINNIIEQLNGKQETITSALKKPLLHFVIEQNHSNIIKSLLQSGCNDWALKLDTFGRTPLHYAIENDRSSIIEKLLDDELLDDIGTKDILKHGSFAKPEYENSKLVKFIDIQDKSGETALCWAIREKNLDFAFQLLFKGASVESLTDAHVEVLIDMMLYDKGKKYEEGKYDIFNLGIWAAYANQDNKYRPIQEKLLLKTPGIFKTLNAKDQSRILSYFFVHGRIKVIEALLETIDDLKQRKEILNRSDNSCKPLDRVNLSDQLSDDDRLKITNYLLTNGATETNIGPNDHITKILYAAADCGHMKTFEYFIHQEHRQNYETHLLRAAQYSQYSIIQYFNNNLKVYIDPEQNTALHSACDSNASLKIIKSLIDNGTPINVKNNNGETPLFMAIFARRELNLIEYLVTQGADVSCEDNFHSTPLSYALTNNQVDIIKYLLKKNARISSEASQSIKEKFAFFKNPNQYNLDLVDENGFPRLHTAIKSWDFELAEFLVRYGADINKLDAQGNTPLHCACKLKPSRCDIDHDEMVELLLQYGAFFDKRDSNNCTPHNLLSRSSNDGIIWLLDVLNKLFSSQNLMQDLKEQILESESGRLKDWGDGYSDVWDCDNPMLFILNSRNTEGKTLLHIAADTNDAESINVLLEYIHGYLGRRGESLRYLDMLNYRSTSIDAVDSQGNTPLHLAAQKGHYTVVSLLLKKGAIFNSENLQGETPEVLATNNNHSNIVELLQPTKNLFIAIDGNNKLAAANCIEEGAYINAKNQDGKAPLHLAASSGQLDVVQLLLDHGVDIEAIDCNKNTPLHAAAAKNKIENVKLLLKYEAIYNTKNAQDQEPLDLAHGQSHELLGQIDTLFKKIHSDNPQVSIDDLEKIHQNYNIDIGTIINTRDNQVNSLLHYAAKSDEFDIVKVLLENGAIFNAQNKWERTPLMLTHDNAITASLLKAIKYMFDDIYLVQKTVSIKIITNVRDDAGRGLLHHVTSSGNLDQVKFLVEKGADVNAKGKDGSTVLHYAVQHSENNLDIVRILVKEGADVNAKGKDGSTVLHYAVQHSENNLDIVRFLVKEGADVNAKGKDGSTVLHYAVQHSENNLDIVRFLVKEGADVNAKGKDGSTVLHYAVHQHSENNLNIVRFLVKEGADVNAKGKDGSTVLHYAVQQHSVNNLNIVRFLVKEGADVNAKGKDGSTVLHYAVQQHSDNNLDIQ